LESFFSEKELLSGHAKTDSQIKKNPNTEEITTLKGVFWCEKHILFALIIAVVIFIVCQGNMTSINYKGDFMNRADR